MKSEQKHTMIVAGMAFTVFLLLASGPGRGAPSDKVDQKIRYLIGYVSTSGLTFIRNATEYSSGEAAEHMNKKYQHFKDDIETPDDFIVLCATKSLLTGKPYLVVGKRGKQFRTSDWLQAELVAYQVRSR